MALTESVGVSCIHFSGDFPFVVSSNPSISFLNEYFIKECRQKWEAAIIYLIWSWNISPSFFQEKNYFNVWPPYHSSWRFFLTKAQLMLYLQLMVFLTDEHCRLSLPPRKSFVQQNSSSSGSQHVTRNRKIHLTIMMLMFGRSERPFEKQMDFIFSCCICPLHAKYCLSDGAQLFILKHIINSISISAQTQQSSCCLNMRQSTLSVFNFFSPNNQCKIQKNKIVLRQWTQSCPSPLGVCDGNLLRMTIEYKAVLQSGSWLC